MAGRRFVAFAGEPTEISICDPDLRDIASLVHSYLTKQIWCTIGIIPIWCAIEFEELPLARSLRYFHLLTYLFGPNGLSTIFPSDFTSFLCR